MTDGVAPRTVDSQRGADPHYSCRHSRNASGISPESNALLDNNCSEAFPTFRTLAKTNIYSSNWVYDRVNPCCE